MVVFLPLADVTAKLYTPIPCSRILYDMEWINRKRRIGDCSEHYSESASFRACCDVVTRVLIACIRGSFRGRMTVQGCIVAS